MLTKRSFDPLPMSLRRRVALVGLVAPLTFVAACGSSGGGDAKDATTTAAPTTTEATTTTTEVDEDAAGEEFQGLVEDADQAITDETEARDELAADNDLDGAIDCMDTGCQAEGIAVCDGTTAVVVAPADYGTASNAECENDVNEDDNDHTDCEDFGCSQNPDVTVCGGENTNALCGDGIDNDSPPNGFVDCADFSCSMNPNVTVCPGERSFEECSNGMDDDGNNFIDCADFSCAPPEGGGSPSPACF
jgi:hypothetical protein